MASAQELREIRDLTSSITTLNRDNLDVSTKTTSSLKEQVNLSERANNLIEKTNSNLIQQSSLINNVISNLRAELSLQNDILKVQKERSTIKMSTDVTSVTDAHPQVPTPNNTTPSLVDVSGNKIPMPSEQQTQTLSNNQEVTETEEEPTEEPKKPNFGKLEGLDTEAFSGILKLTDQIIDKSDTRNVKLKEAGELLKGTLTGLDSVAILTEKRLELDKQLADVQATNFGVNEELKKDILDQIEASEALLKTEQDKQEVIKQTTNIANKFGEGLSEPLVNLQSEVKKLPVVGNVLSNIIPAQQIKGQIGQVTESFTSSFGESFSQGINSGQGFVKSFSGSLKQGKAAARATMSKLGPILTNPYVAAGVAIVAFMSLGLIAFKMLDDATKKFRDETGLLVSQTGELTKSIGNVYSNTAGLGASLDDVAKAAGEFVNTFDGIEKPSEAVLESVVTLNKNFGVGVKEATELNKVFQNIGGLTAEQSQMLVGQTAEMAKIAGVAPQKVIKDMADNAGAAYTYFGGMPEELAAAAVSAAKMGTSIKEAANVANSLLDYESSVTKELEASAILGTNLNLSRARYLAANNDILGAQQAVLDQVSHLGDLTKLNKYEQDALVEATGMELESLVNQQRVRERYGKLADEDLATALQLLKAGKDISKIDEEDLKLKTKELQKQKEMQSEFDNMANSLKEIGAEFMMSIMPVGTAMMALLKGILIPIINAVKGIMRAFSPIQEIMADLLGDGDGISEVFTFIGKLIAGPITYGINLFANQIKAVLSLVNGVYKIFKGIFTGDFDMIAEGLLSIGESILRFFFGIPMALFDTFMDMFPKVGKGFESFIQSVQDIIAKLLSGVLPDFSGLFNFDLRPLMDGMKKVGGAYLKSITAIPKLLFNGLSNIGSFLVEKLSNIGSFIFEKIKEGFTNLPNTFVEAFLSIGEKIRTFFEGLLPSWARGMLSGGKSDSSEMQESQQLSFAGSIDDGIVQDGNIVSTDPEDTLIASKEPQSLLSGLVENSPFAAIAGGLSNIVGGQGGDNTLGNQQIIQKLDEIKEAYMSNKDVYMDKEKVSSNVLKQNERSSENIFGLGFS